MGRVHVRMSEGAQILKELCRGCQQSVFAEQQLDGGGHWA